MKAKLCEKGLGPAGVEMRVEHLPVPKVTEKKNGEKESRMKKIAKVALMFFALVLAISSTSTPSLESVGFAPASATVVDHIDPQTTVDLVILTTKTSTACGTVHVTNDDSYLYVTFNTNTGWHLKKLYLHVATKLSKIPQKGGQPQATKFKFRKTLGSGVTTYTFKIPYTWPYGTNLTVAAKATVVDIDTKKSKTAWGFGYKFPRYSRAAYFFYQLSELFGADFTWPEYGTKLKAILVDNYTYWIAQTEARGWFKGTLPSDANDTIWIFLKPLDSSKVWPQPIVNFYKATGDWRAQWDVYMSGPVERTHQDFELLLVKLTPEATGFVWWYKHNGDATGEWPGIDVPECTVILAKVYVSVCVQPLPDQSSG